MKFMVFTVLMISLTATIVPCCAFDGCQDELSNIFHQEKKEQKGACSPFFACASCAGPVEVSKLIQLAEPILEKQIHHEKISAFNPSAHPSTFWQPPRSC